MNTKEREILRIRLNKILFLPCLFFLLLEVGESMEAKLCFRCWAVGLFLLQTSALSDLDVHSDVIPPGICKSSFCLRYLLQPDSDTLLDSESLSVRVQLSTSLRLDLLERAAPSLELCLGLKTSALGVAFLANPDGGALQCVRFTHFAVPLPLSATRG